MADWRPAPSVKLGLTEANERWPGRNIASDGMLGDAAHSSRESDHNPDDRGVVHAYDLTHDPGSGVDCGRLSAGIVARRDPRLRYVIWNRRICKGPWSDSVLAGRAQPWEWEAYTGLNPHEKHMHVSVGYGMFPETNLDPWYGLEEDDMTTDELLAALRSAEGKKTLRAALWGGVGEEIPSVSGTVNAAQTVEVAATDARTAKQQTAGLAADHAQLKAQVANLAVLVEGLVLGKVQGDLTVTGTLHLEDTPT